MWIKLKTFLLDLFFPKFCLNCSAEGDYLCQDCQGMLSVSGFHEKSSIPYLSDLYFPLSYQNPLLKELIRKFKYDPYIRELAGTLADLIIAHFQRHVFLEGFHPPETNVAVDAGHVRRIGKTKKISGCPGVGRSPEVRL